MKRLLIIFFFLGMLSFPWYSLADGTYNATVGGNTYTVTYEGLVPCGKDVDMNGQSFSTLFRNNRSICPVPENCEMPCQLCHLFVMTKGILDFLIEVVIFIALLMIVIAGIMFMIAHSVSPENPALMATARRVITSVAIGMVIMFAAWIFINTFFLLIGVADLNPGAGWRVNEGFIINCPITVE